MSILVWDGKVLACDSHANDGATIMPFPKVWRLDSGVLIGAVGLLKDIAAITNWYSAGATLSKFPNLLEPKRTTLIEVTGAGVFRYPGSPLKLAHGIGQMAFGEGKDVAYGALEMGADAIRAVEIAIKYNIHCNGFPIAVTNNLGENAP